MEPKRPRKTFRAGSVRASVWDNDRMLPNGEHAIFPKVCVERRYKNEHGEWVSSNHFSINELAKLQAVIRAAFDYLTLDDQESGPAPVLVAKQEVLDPVSGSTENAA